MLLYVLVEWLYQVRYAQGTVVCYSIKLDIHQILNTPVSRSINTAVHYDHRFICTGLASFESKSFVKVNNNVKNVQIEQY